MSELETSKPKAVAILLAGGSGSRMQGAVEDKVLVSISGKPVIRHSIDTFIDSAVISAIIFVCRNAAQQANIESTLSKSSVSIIWAIGGSERQDSVWSGLQQVPDNTDVVLIHDCARPCITVEAIKQSVALVRESGAACLAHKVTDTIKSASRDENGYLLKTVDRSNLWAMETPQSFKYQTIFDAYRKVIATGTAITDDLSAIECDQSYIALVDNGRPNPKLTTAQDLAYIELVLNS